MAKTSKGSVETALKTSRPSCLLTADPLTVKLVQKLLPREELRAPVKRLTLS